MLKVPSYLLPLTATFPKSVKVFPVKCLNPETEIPTEDGGRSLSDGPIEDFIIHNKATMATTDDGADCDNAHQEIDAPAVCSALFGQLDSSIKTT